MKFGRSLRDNAVEEWSTYYINYKALKKLIRGVCKAHNGETGEDMIPLTARELLGLSTKHEEKTVALTAELAFFDLLRCEIGRVEDFYFSYKRALESGAVLLLNAASRLGKKGAEKKEEEEKEEEEKEEEDGASDEDGEEDGEEGEEISDLDLRLRRHYRALRVFRDRYVELNLLGFRKILKKYDKRSGTSVGGRLYRRLTSVPNRPVTVFSPSVLDKLMERIQDTYARAFCGGSQREAEIILTDQRAPTPTKRSTIRRWFDSLCDTDPTVVAAFDSVDWGEKPAATPFPRHSTSDAIQPVMRSDSRRTAEYP